MLDQSVTKDFFEKLFKGKSSSSLSMLGIKQTYGVHAVLKTVFSNIPKTYFLRQLLRHTNR